MITLIGAGNVATSLGSSLEGAGHRVRQVWSRTEEAARELGERLSCPWTTDISQVDGDCDVALISVKDSEIGRLAENLRTDALVVHTAGSVPLAALPQAKAGVMYPMQTFTKERLVNLKNVPLFVETKRAEDMPTLKALAESLSQDVRELGSDDRCRLHIAAVFACNFTNHCYALAADVLESAGLPFELLLPLIDETARKVHVMSPEKAQTGPAARWDQGVMERHLELLEGRQRDIYELLSGSIRQSRERRERDD